MFLLFQLESDRILLVNYHLDICSQWCAWNISVYRIRNSATLILFNYYQELSLVDVQASSVFVNTCLQAQIADYSLDKRIADLCSTVNKDAEIPGATLAPGRGGKKADIFKLVCCVSIFIWMFWLLHLSSLTV